MKRFLLCAIVLSGAALSLDAQQDNTKFGSDMMRSFQEYRKQMYTEYENYLGEINKQYADFLREAWKPIIGEKAVPKPKKEPEPIVVPPVVIPDNEPQPEPIDRPIVIEEVIPTPQPEPAPEPKPVIEIKEVPQPVQAKINVVFYGLKPQLRYDKLQTPRLQKQTDENAVAKMWETLCDGRANNLLIDCLQFRKDNSLCDWAYFQFLQLVSEQIYSGLADQNEKQVFLAFLLNQSGFKTRMARDDDKQLHLLVATDSQLYDYNRWTIDNDQYFLLEEKNSPIHSLYITSHRFPEDKALRIGIAEQNNFGKNLSKPRHVQSKRYPAAQADVVCNTDLINFFNSYPTSVADQDVMTRWWFYAMTPLNKTSEESLYPALKTAIAGKTEEQAANILINFVQTAFTYGYDNEVWGHDRAFFAEETLFYPYSDCEDRAILFSRLVRDLIGLDVILIMYPGHMATAVHFNQNVKGDYVTYNGKRYLVCDPTYINAPIGITMEGMDNNKIKAIALQ